MSLFYYYYELSGWLEWCVVMIFWVVGLLFVMFGIYIEVWI